MRAAVVVVLAIGCGERAAPIAAVKAPPKPAPVVDAPFEVAVVGADGASRVVRWTDDLAVAEPREDSGAIAYVQRMTVLHTDDVDVGWLEPGARVGVAEVSRGRVDVVLFGWTGPQARGHPRAWVDPRALGPAPPRDRTPYSAPSHGERTIAAGQTLRRLDGGKLGYTFCGTVEVIEDDARGMRIVQREDGVALEGRVDAKAHWQDGRCPGLAVIDDGTGRRQLVYHERQRAYVERALPAGLAEAGPYTGPTFAQLVARRAPVFWLVETDRGPVCDAWQLAPPKRGEDDGQLMKREKLDDGDTVVTQFGVMYGAAPDTSVVLLGPSSEVIAPRGREPHHGAGAFGCGSDFLVVESEPGQLTMLRRPPALAARVIAYDPLDTEPWYTDRARCERDADARRKRVAGAPLPHRGC